MTVFFFIIFGGMLPLDFDVLHFNLEWPSLTYIETLIDHSHWLIIRVLEIVLLHSLVFLILHLQV